MLHPHSSGSLRGLCGMGRRWEIVRERFLRAISRGGVHHIHPCSIGQFYIPNLTERSWEIQLAMCMRRREIWLLVNTSIICHDQHLMECWSCMIFMSLITCRPSKQTDRHIHDSVLLSQNLPVNDTLIGNSDACPKRTA